MSKNNGDDNNNNDKNIDPNLEAHMNTNSLNISVNNIDEEQDESNKLPYRLRVKIFVMFLLANGFLNYDTGVIPASLLTIEKEIHLTYKEQALIGSLVYLGLSFASLFVSLLFNKFGPAKVCSFMLLFNSICCFIFSFSSNKPVLFSCRFLMGVTEAFIVIYGPVWVNNYSPPEHSTKWMGILHTFSALGVILGYIVAGVIINFFELSWRYAIQVQGFAEIPICLYFWFENEDYINLDVSGKKPTFNNSKEEISSSFNKTGKKQSSNNVKKSYFVDSKQSNFKDSIKKQSMNETIKEKHTDNISNFNKSINQHSVVSNKPRRRLTRLDTIQTSDFSLYCYQAKEVLTNLLWIWVCFGLCSMYFIVTGIQFWITSYLVDFLNNDPVQVIFIFSIISITAPMSGVLIGSTFADNYGGYKGKNVIKALKLCSAFGVVAFIFSFPIGFLYSIIYVSVLLWAFLFFGAAIVPVGTGIMVSCVSKEAQATSSSLSQLIFNFFGYFLSPILTGIIMDAFDNKMEGYKWGMRVIFWWSIFAAIFMGFALLTAIRRNKKNQDNRDDISLVDDEMGQNMGDLIQLEIMRRMAYNL